VSSRTYAPTESANELRANPPKLLRVSEAAIVVGLSTRTINRLIASGKLRVCRLGRRVIIRREDLFEYVDNSLTGSSGDKGKA
jgi:excisionase family DNA binding protein